MRADQKKTKEIASKVEQMQKTFELCKEAIAARAKASYKYEQAIQAFREADKNYDAACAAYEEAQKAYYRAIK